MKVEKLDRVALDVKNLEETMRLFSDLLGISFQRIPFRQVQPVRKVITEHADRAFEETKHRVAISPAGLELLEITLPTQKEGMRSFHFKVSDLEEAKAEMVKKGIRLLADIALGGLREAVYSPDDLHGARLTLVEYDTPTVMEAIQQKRA